MRAEWIRAKHGPLLIAIGSLIWATDSLARFHAARFFDPVLIVFCEHLICVLVLAPWIIYKYGKSLFKFNLREWGSLVMIGAGASALATVLFTRSFQNINPSVTILLQKIQPILVVALAAFFLGEKPKSGFYFWSALAFTAAFGVSFPGYDLSFLREGFNPTSIGVLQAMGAASIWAIATVVGRSLLREVHSEVATFWRFFFGLLGLSLFLFFRYPPTIAVSLVVPNALIATLVYMGLFPGILAMLLYYRGLSKTPASIATFVELIFPISAVFLNAIFLGMPLAVSQLVAGTVLLLTIAKISSLT